MKKVTKVCFVVILAILLLAILICPDYITNPVVTTWTFRFCESRNIEIFLDSYDRAWLNFSDDVVDYAGEIFLTSYSVAALLAILGSCIYCLVRKLRKAHKPTSLSAPKARWKKKLAFGLLLLMIVLVRPNPVMSTLLFPISFIKTSFPKSYLFGYNPIMHSSNEIVFYTSLIGDYVGAYEHEAMKGLWAPRSNIFYQIRIILIVIFIVVARHSVAVRDKRAQPEEVPQEH